MMGAHHAATGAAGWIAIAGSAPMTLGLIEATPTGVIAGAIVCAGAALAPDADHHNATIAHSLPPFSNILTSFVGTISGGHRQGTHSILGVLAFLGLAAIASPLTINTAWFGDLAIGAGIISLALAAFAMKALKITHGVIMPWVVSAMLAFYIMVFAPTEFAWLPMAIGTGVVIHIAGDMLTTGGAPVLWPWKPKPPKWWQATPVINRIWQPNGFFGLPILGNTGSFREWLLVVPVSAYAIYGVASAVGAAIFGDWNIAYDMVSPVLTPLREAITTAF